MAGIKAKPGKGSVFYTDDFKSCKSLKHYGKHSKIKKTKAYAIGRTHINGIEGFWSFTKERFHRYNEFHRNSCTQIAEQFVVSRHTQRQLLSLPERDGVSVQQPKL